MGVSTGAAGTLLAVTVLAFLGIVLAYSIRPNVFATFTVLIAGVAALTLIGWLAAWVMILIALMIAGLFGKRMYEVWSG